MKFAKTFRYNWRTEKERLLGIVDPFQQYAILKASKARDLRLKAEHQRNSLDGYCLCGYPLTTLGKCMVDPKGHTAGCINPRLTDDYVLALR